MHSTQTARPWSRTRPPESPEPDAPAPADPLLAAPARERDGRREIAALRDEIEHIVRRSNDSARETVDTALESVTRLQVATANIEACRPTPAAFAGAQLVALADARLRGHADAIERGMTYTADNQLQLLRGERP